MINYFEEYLEWREHILRSKSKNFFEELIYTLPFLDDKDHYKKNKDKLRGKQAIKDFNTAFYNIYNTVLFIKVNENNLVQSNINLSKVVLWGYLKHDKKTFDKLKMAHQMFTNGSSTQYGVIEDSLSKFISIKIEQDVINNKIVTNDNKPDYNSNLPNYNNLCERYYSRGLAKELIDKNL